MLEKWFDCVSKIMIMYTKEREIERELKRLGDKTPPAGARAPDLESEIEHFYLHIS